MEIPRVIRCCFLLLELAPKNENLPTRKAGLESVMREPDIPFFQNILGHMVRAWHCSVKIDQIIVVKQLVILCLLLYLGTSS